MVKRQTERSILRSVVTCGIFSLLILESTCAEVRAQTTIRLQEDVVLHQSPVIRLGDIAQVTDLSAAMVSAFEDLELLPISSREMEVTRETIRDRLGLLGVDLYSIRWEGASVVVIKRQPKHSGAERAASTSGVVNGVVNDASMANAKLSKPPSWQVKQVKQHVEQHVAPALFERGLELESVQLTPEVAKAVGNFARLGEVTLASGFDSGDHQVILEVSDAGETRTLPMDVVTRQCEQAIFLTEGLEKGHVIQASDLEFRPIPSERSNPNMLKQAKTVVGKELVYMARADQPVTQNMIRQPVMVRSNRTVVVENISGNIRVRTYGVARQDGSFGDVINVELGKDRRKLLAEVVGEDRVQVKSIR